MDAVVDPPVGSVGAGAGKLADQRAICPGQGLRAETERHLDDVGAAAVGSRVGHRKQQHLERRTADGTLPAAGFEAQAARRREGEFRALDGEPSLVRKPGAKQSAQGRG